MTKTQVITSQNQNGIVTLSQNTPGVATPIMKIVVPDGARYFLPNVTVVDGAVYNGAVVIARVLDNTGTVIRDGNLHFGTFTPAAEFITPRRSVPMSNWADLSTTDQRNAKFRGGLAQNTDLNVGPGLTLQNRASLIISLESAEVIDWTKSFLEITFEEVNQ